ncbi:hypothetical protein [Ureaplasma ceti]|uniref:Uncharacterized protein n=1 Tax=Ureaplasma ceti TaxID=3119530 RepID=A0ABP9UAJ6_9BACT
MRKFWFSFQTIFYKDIKFIKLSKVLTLIDNEKYVVIEFVKAKFDNLQHFPNALQINILQYQSVLRLVDPNQIILINNNHFFASQYYRFLKKNGRKVYFIKQHKKE